MKTFAAKTIAEAWQQVVGLCLGHGLPQVIDRGSFVGGEITRLQLPYLCGEIEYPTADMVPATRPGIPPVSSPATLEQYFAEYLIGTRPPAPNEAYTYASRIGDQLQAAMDILARAPGTNQASVVVARPEDLTLTDPACLRVLDFKVVAGALNLCSFWRSHDLWAGFPVNLGGLALLLAHVAEYADLPVGRLQYCSTGTHLYSYQLDLARAQVGGDPA